VDLGDDCASIGSSGDLVDFGFASSKYLESTFTFGLYTFSWRSELGSTSMGDPSTKSACGTDRNIDEFCYAVHVNANRE